jgi:hypothetical protein
MEMTVNPAFTLGEADFVQSMLAALDVYPAYYAHMAPANAAGPAEPDLAAPRHADSTELRRRIEAGEWVVDLRSRVAFAAGHLRGTLSFELCDHMTTYLGWLIPWGTSLTLLGGSAAEVASAQRDLVRIGRAVVGHERRAAWSGGEQRQVRVTNFASYARARGQQHPCCRRASAVQVGTPDRSAVIPLHELAGRLDEIGAGQV